MKKWHNTNIKKVGHGYTIISDGILSREDYNILFASATTAKGEIKRYIPKETADAINIYSDVTFSGNFFRFMNNSGISVNLFDKYGRHTGTFMPSQATSSAKTMLKQAAIYLDEVKRTDIARKIEMAAMHNLLANLKYYDRRKNADFKNAIAVINEVSEKMKNAKDISTLMILEAKARRVYYGMFNNILSNAEFTFSMRTRRPPKDPLNALISFGNVVLYNDIATEIAKTSLDMRIGFLHATGDRSQSLNLDIAEIFKPLIVDRSIFTVVNRRMLNARDHFQVNEDGGVYMNVYGKQIFLKELESKMNLVQSDGGKSMTYLSRIKEEIGKINRMVVKGEEYTPYRYEL